MAAEETPSLAVSRKLLTHLHQSSCINLRNESFNITVQEGRRLHYVVAYIGTNTGIIWRNGKILQTRALALSPSLARVATSRYPAIGKKKEKRKKNAAASGSNRRRVRIISNRLFARFLSAL